MWLRWGVRYRGRRGKTTFQYAWSWGSVKPLQSAEVTSVTPSRMGLSSTSRFASPKSTSSLKSKTRYVIKMIFIIPKGWLTHTHTHTHTHKTQFEYKLGYWSVPTRDTCENASLLTIFTAQKVPKKEQQQINCVLKFYYYSRLSGCNTMYPTTVPALSLILVAE